MKNPLTPARIEPATFRFVAQHLNHCATAVPSYQGLGKVNVRVKFTLEQATKAHRGSRSITLLFL